MEYRELDALLERAYALEEPERSRFVQGLPEEQRTPLEELLELSHALTLESLASKAKAALGGLESPAATIEPTTTGDGRWRLHRAVGSGGMGQVFYATREPQGGADADYVQEAAIKLMWSFRADEEVRARFIRERRLLASLDHPGLARFVDGGFLGDGRPWFAMEYVEGKTIDVHAQGLGQRERLSLFLDVCSTVAHAHQHLIVHRDIKPTNILVDGSGRARLLDFGIAGVLEDIDDGVHTRTSGGPLTPQYASPEQLSGAVVTAASDIYQLGLLLYELASDARPFALEGAPLAQAVDLICHRLPPKPSVKNPEVSRDLDAIIMTALAKDPEARYGSAIELAEDVERYLQGRPVKAVPHTSWYLARRFVRRNALVTTLVVAAALVLFASTLVSIYLARQASSEAARSRAVQQILVDVFQTANPFGGQGGELSLAEAMVRAQPDIERRTADDPLLAWEVNLTVAQIYEELGIVEEEQAAFQRVYEAAKSLPGGSGSRRTLVAIAGLGNILARTNPAEAVTYFEANLPSGPPSSEGLRPWLDAQYAFAGALARVGEEHRAAAETLAMARAMDRFGVEEPVRRGRLSQLLAGVAKRQGDGEAEDRHWRDMLKYMRAADDPSALAITLNNWAIHLGRLKRYEASEEAFREALAIFHKAKVRDATYGTLLRGYAGLLFRTGRVDEARAMTREVLSLLPPDTQAYARFVAQVNLAQYAFVAGDLEETLEVIKTALPAALREFPSEPAVPRRMARLFAKALVLADAAELAALAIGDTEAKCEDEARLLAALEGLEHPQDKAARAAIWKGLTALEDGPERRTSAQAADFIENYQKEVPTFFDALDHWRVLHRLASRLGPARLAPTARRRYESLIAERSAGQRLVENTPALRGLAEALGRTGETPAECQ